MKKLLFSFKVGIHLYVIGAIVILLGCFLVIPTMSRVERFWQDPIFFLGAPIVMNGITVIVFGIIMLAFGQVIALLNRISEALASYQTPNADDRILVKCPTCAQQLRVPKGRKGILSCPKCGNKFEEHT
jgi:hypothetical protein